ncbi:MAG TPA: response regulator [Myxococcales bacterium]|nr:response regulator [Myxococcales bacterium]
MSLPHLLLVDDSEAVLAFQRAALSSHYAISTAMNGREALAKVPQIDPAAILLDLSMPEMDGDEVLAHLQDHPDHRRIPVIIISSEKPRAEACLRNGAKAFLPKPIRAQELLPLVERVLEEARAAARAGNVTALFVSVGKIEVGLPLDCVRNVLHQTATQPIPLGPSYLTQMIELYGEPVAVLDLARRLGVEHVQPLLERKLVVVEREGARIALCVDDVRDPEELTAAEVTPRELLGGSQHGALQEALLGVAKTSRGPLPLIDPRALISRELLRKLASGLRAEALR